MAVGANWKKLRKKLGPLLEKCGLQMADFGDFLSAASEEDFMSEVTAETSRPKRQPAARKKTGPKKQKTAPVTPPSRRKDEYPPFTMVRPTAKRKTASRKPLAATDAETHVADGTYGN